jgi:hypothetical protein
MIQKAGSNDNTLGVYGWQSADHWFTAILDSQGSIQVGQLVWVRLDASIIKHLSFTNYRISAKRDGGKVCAGVLSGGVISERSDSTKNTISTVVEPTALSGELPDLPEAFSKTQINVIQAPEVPVKLSIEQLAPNVSKTEKVISLPDLPSAVQPFQESEKQASLLDADPQVKKKTSPILPIAIGLILLGITIAGYFLTRGSSEPAKPNNPTQVTPPLEVKPSSPTPVSPPTANPPVAPQPPKAPSSNTIRPSSPGPAVPDVNKIVRETLNK